MEAILDFFLESDYLILRIIGWIIMIVCLLLGLALIAVVVLLVIFCINTARNTVTVDDFRFYRHDGYATLSAYEGDQTAIVLPIGVGDLPVTAFGLMTDRNGMVEELTIPDTVGLDSALIITFPALQNYHVSDTHPAYTVIDGALYTRDGRTLISYPQGRTGVAVIPEGVETIREGAFMYSAASEVILPQSLRTIESRGLCGFRVLRILEIPASVTTIDEGAFTPISSGDAVQPQLIVTEGSAAHTLALAENLRIRQVLPAGEPAATETPVE